MATRLIYPTGLTDDERQAIAGGGGLTPVLATSTPITATEGNLYVVDVGTIAGPIVANLPTSPVDGDQIGFVDGSGSDPTSATGFGLHSLTINADGAHDIQGINPLVLETENESIWLTFDATLASWRIVTHSLYGSSGGADLPNLLSKTSLASLILSADNNNVGFTYSTPGERDVVFTNAAIDTESGFNIGTGEYTFSADAFVYIQGQIMLDDTGVDRVACTARLQVDTGGGYTTLFVNENFGGTSHSEKEGFTVSGFYSASTGDNIKLTFESTGSDSIAYQPAPENSFLKVTQIYLTNSAESEEVEVLLNVNNNSVDFTTNTGRTDLVLTTASVDLDSGYNNGNGEYTFSRDSLILAIGNLRNNVASAFVLSGLFSIDFQVDTGSGFNLIATGQDFSGNGHSGTDGDTVFTMKAFNASSGHKIKATHNNTKGNGWNVSGDPVSTNWQLIDLSSPSDERNRNRLLLDAHNNGVVITHTAASGYEDVIFSTAAIDLESGYNNGTGEYTIAEDGVYLIISQFYIGNNNSTSLIYEPAINIDRGSGYNIESNWGRFNGGSFNDPTIHNNNIFNLSAGDKVKISTGTDGGGVVDYSGATENSFFQVIDLTGFLPALIRNRVVLEEDTTFYVDPTGSNTNDGLSPGTAFKDVQFAVDYAMSTDPLANAVTVELAAGDYTAEGAINLPKGIGSSYTLKGTTPNTAVVDACFIGSSSTWTLEDMTMDSSVNRLISVSSFASCFLKGVTHLRDSVLNPGFGPYIGVFGGSLTLLSGASIEVTNTSTPPGDEHNSFLYCQENGSIRMENGTINFNNNIRFGHTILAVRSSTVNVANVTWGGAGTVTNGTNKVGAFQGTTIVLNFGGSVIPGNLGDNIETSTSCHLIV